MIDTALVQETAILVGIKNNDQTDRLSAEYLDELEFLVDTAGAKVLKRFSQKMEYPNPRTFVGEGKLAEITAYVEEHGIDMVVFDDELSPSQMRNLDKSLKCKILDRTNLILDIFAKRAQTAHAKIQVELAQYQYLLPRLVGMWTHLERQQGGIGMRGPGETEIETDRRVIRERIALLKEHLKKIDKQMATQRKSRGQMIRVSLVGYTNVGKSTIMNMLSKSEVFAENKLFATLDTTVRKVVVGNLPFLLSDTVGFIRKLPHHLVESFKSTLDEVREADILLHVVDISHPSFEEQIEVVNQTLQDLKVTDKPIFIVFNKIDAYSFTPKDHDDLSPVTRDNWTLEDMKNTWMAKANAPCLFISATQKLNIELLRSTIYDKVREIHVARYPYDKFLF
jgi:GTP-binding protein HflX